MSTPAQDLYERQLSLLSPDTVDELVETQYTEDAVLLSGDKAVRGREELRAHFGGYLVHLGGITLLSTDLFAETDDLIMFEATVETGTYGKVRVYDSWTLKDGKIWRHVTGRFS